MRRSLLSLLLFTVACGGDDAPSTDGAPDAIVVDAAIDAPLDGPAIDASVIDAPALDAPALDAPALDAPVIDAPIDAAPVSWPIETATVGYAQGIGLATCDDLGQYQVGWLGVRGSIGGEYGNAFVDSTMVAPFWGSPWHSPCSAALTSSGALVYVFTEDAPRTVTRTDGAALAVPGATRILATDPDGGVIVVAGTDLVRLNAGFAIDSGFATAGRLPLAAPPAERVVQGTTAPMLTVRVGARLHRLDLRSGAAIAGFGTAGEVMLPVAAADIVAMAPLPGDAVAVVARTTGGLSVVRVDATGALTTAMVPLGEDVLVAFTDTIGHVVVSVASPPGVLRVARVDLATAALDPGFGTGGRASITLPTMACPSDYPNPNPGIVSTRWRGVLGAGPLLITADIGCSAAGHYPERFTRYFVYAGS